MKRKATEKVWMTAALLGISLTVSGATIDWTGTTYMVGTPNDYKWVLGSEMWESLQSAAATATSQDGFSYFSTHDITDLNWTFGNLELSSYLEPGPASAGFEVYSETNGVTQPLNFYMGDLLVASADIDFLRVDVENDSDITATGSAEATLNNSVTGNDLYNELMTLSGGTGKLSVDINNFFPGAETGNVVSTGTLSVVPEASTTAMLTTGILMLFCFRCIRTRYSR